jgi:hypothetical protein
MADDGAYSVAHEQVARDCVEARCQTHHRTGGAGPVEQALQRARVVGDAIADSAEILRREGATRGLGTPLRRGDDERQRGELGKGQAALHQDPAMPCSRR